MQAIEKPIQMKEMYVMLNVCENTFRYTMLNPLLRLQETTNIDIGVIPRKTPKRIQYMFQPQKFLEAIKLLNKQDIGGNKQCQPRKNILDLKKERASFTSTTMLRGSCAVSQLERILS